ncbi:MAG: NTP transferase domain-containing protein [Polyangiaceae bacterium]|nr:NTP transferase domain-containing protein [Polyangiaceae bacterium]
MVLCAGLGTRLRPLTGELPKPLVPIGDRSVLEHALDHLEPHVAGKVVVNVHHLPREFERLRSRVEVILEGSLLGTAGGVAGARSLLEPPALVWNGDILLSGSCAEPLKSLMKVDFLSLLGVARPAGQGTVGVGSGGEVVRLRGERFGEERAGADYVGVCALGGRALAALPPAGCLIGDVALPYLRSGGRVEVVVRDLGWTDAGDPGAYLAANLGWLADAGRDAWVGPEASLGPGVTLEQAVVGRGARVEGWGRLRRVVVWPGAVACAPLEDAVVTPARVVHVVAPVAS